MRINSYDKNSYKIVLSKFSKLKVNRQLKREVTIYISESILDSRTYIYKGLGR